MSRHLLRTACLATALFALFLCPSALLADIIDDFESGVLGTPNQQSGAPGPAVVDDGTGNNVLRLLSTANGLANQYAYDLSASDARESVLAEFDFLVTSGGNPADGFSFMLLPTSDYGTTGVLPTGGAAEEPNFPNTFAVAFDLYPGENEVSVHNNGALLAENDLAPATIDLDANVYHRASISLTHIGAGSNVQVSVQNDVNGGGAVVPVFNQWLSGVLPYESRPQFSGRTGGLNMQADIDNLSVVYDPTPYFPLPLFPVPELNEDFDFEGTTPSTTVRGGSTLPGPLVLTGGPSGNFLRLVNDNIAGQNNRIAFDAAANQSGAGGTRVEFDFRIGGAGDSADGMGVALLRTGNHGTTGAGPGFSEEANLIGSLGVGFDVHDNGGEGAQSISLHFNNSPIVSVPAGVNIEDGNWYRAAIDVVQQTGGSNVSVTLTPVGGGASVTPISQFVAGVNVYDYRVSITGRTGGLNSDTDLDNISSSVLLSAETPDGTVQTFEGGVGTDFQLRRYNTAPGPEIQNGGPTGNFLRLIHDVGNQSSTIGLDQSPLLAAPTGELVAEFDYRMPDETGYTGSERADGFGFALLETSAWGTEGPAPNSGSQSDSHDPSLPINWERPRWHDALGIGFDLYNNNNENTVSLNWDGLEIATNYIDPNTFLLNNSLFNHVTVTALANDGGALVTVVITPDIHGTPGTPIVVFDNVPVAGMDLTTMSFRGGFGGRTGGQRTYVDLDNINIVPEPSSLVLLLLAVMGLVTLRRR